MRYLIFLLPAILSAQIQVQPVRSFYGLPNYGRTYYPTQPKQQVTTNTFTYTTVNNIRSAPVLQVPKYKVDTTLWMDRYPNRKRTVADLMSTLKAPKNEETD